MDDGARSMSGKICLVTGATSGIGAATALALARKGATVVGVGRSPERCAAGAARIMSATGNSSVEFLLADLSVQEEIRALSRRFQERYRRLDLLVNNAGARFSSRMLSRDGYEMTLALNHLGYFLLTLLLLDRLKDAGRSRVVNVASAAHRSCRGIDFDDLQSERSYDGKAAYAQSKLANLLFSYELARRVTGTGITVNAAAPGNVLTRFSRNNGWFGWLGHIAGSLKSGSLAGAARGAETVLFLACAPELEGRSGGYFSKKRQAPSSAASYDGAAAERLWRESLELTGLQSARCSGISGGGAP